MIARSHPRRRRSSRDVDLLRVPQAELAHCFASASGKIVRHKPGCTIGHPRCKWRRKDAGQVVCECPAYLFPHRQGSGLCGRHVYGQWHRKASDPDRVYVTVEKSGTRERFATLKRAVEHAGIVADHTRRQVAVMLGDRLLHVVRPAGRAHAKRDLVPVEKRAESRTLGLFTGKTKLEEGMKGRHDWKSEAQKASRELAECRRTGRDPSSRTKRFLAWHKKMMAEKREDFRAMTHNVGTLAKAVATGSTIEAIRSGKLQSVRTPIGGWRLGAAREAKTKKMKKKHVARRAPRRLARDPHKTFFVLESGREDPVSRHATAAAAWASVRALPRRGAWVYVPAMDEDGNRVWESLAAPSPSRRSR